MTWARTTQTGSGKLSFRVAIEGIPFEAVTHANMAVDGDEFTATRLVGLSMKGVKLSQEANIPMATIEAKGVSFTLVDVNGAWTAALNTIDMQETWLEGNINQSATASLLVKSTVGFVDEGRLWINSECMLYTGKTATTFTGLTRGAHSTMAQAHYLSSGSVLRSPQVTSQPILYTGRRVRIFVYGAGDDPQGDGTQIWLGLLTGEPRMEGPAWYLNADPISSMLDQELGADLEDPVGPRGVAKLGNDTTGGRDDGIGSITVFLIPNAGSSSTAPRPTAGQWTQSFRVYLGHPEGRSQFFETQQAFVDQVNTNLNAFNSAAANATVTCIADPIYGYYFRITNTATPDGVWIATEYPDPIEPTFDGPTVASFSASSTFDVLPSGYPMPGAGFAPRGSCYISNLQRTPKARVYLGGTVAVSTSTTAAQISWEGTANEGDFGYRVTFAGTADRFIELASENPHTYRSYGQSSPTRYFTPFNPPEIKLGRSYDDGSLNGTHSLLTALQSASPAEVNTGAVPSFQSGDWDSAGWLAAYSGVGALGKRRSYLSVEPVKISDYVCPDLQLGALFLAFDSTGRLTVRRLRLAAATESATFAITKDNLVTDEGFPTFDRGAAGMFNTFSVQDGYVPSLDEYTHPAVIVRDVAAYGQSPAARVIKVEPKSGTLATGADIEAVREIAETYLGIFGNRYAYVQCTVPLSALNGAATTLGSTVSINTKHLPSLAGTRVASILSGIVVSRTIDLYGGRIELKILVVLTRVGGYAFGSRVTSQTNTSGNTWAIVLNSAYFATGDSAGNHLQVGDRTTVYRWNNATGGAVPGTVVSVAVNTVTVAFDSTWTPASDQWALAARTAVDAAVTANMKRYVYLAGTDARIDYGDSTSEPAWTFSP
jgi:hypothetical protein